MFQTFLNNEKNKIPSSLEWYYHMTFFLVLVFTLAFELARRQKLVTDRLTYKQTNRHFDKTLIISKNIIFSMFTYQGFLQTEMPWFRQIFLIKIVSAIFQKFRKKEAKKPLFSCTITILDHTPLYGKVKNVTSLIGGNSTFKVLIC